MCPLFARAVLFRGAPGPDKLGGMIRAALIALPVLALTAAADDPERTYLASIEGVALAEGEFLDRFAIDTWGVDMVAICRIPPGWEMRAGRMASPDGVIAGAASHGVTFLGASELGALRHLVLVRLREPAREAEGNLPATFAGQARIGRYGVDETRREAVLGIGNVRLEPATACSDPSAE